MVAYTHTHTRSLPYSKGGHPGRIEVAYNTDGGVSTCRVWSCIIQTKKVTTASMVNTRRNLIVLVWQKVKFVHVEFVNFVSVLYLGLLQQWSKFNQLKLTRLPHHGK